jgi:very-short-patch-repair endonuclease
MHTAPGEIEVLLQRQHGIVTAAQCRRHGISHQQVRTLLRRGEWLRLYRGIYIAAPAWPHDPSDPLRDLRQLSMRCRALLVVLPAGTVISHQTAAALWRLAVPSPNPTIHVTVPPGAVVPSVAGVEMHRSRAAVSVERPFGVDATSLSRTVVDIARRAGFAEAVALADSALATHPGLDLGSELLRCYGGRGYRQAAAVVAFADERSESPLESLARALWHAADLAAPEIQAVITVDGRFVARVDFLWRAARLVVEVDGMSKYAEPGELAREKQRQNALIRAGYTVLRFTWADIVHRPQETVAIVRECLAASRAG